jgi:hypothetical protein
MTDLLPHEWHAVGNIGACKHCHRAEHMLRPRKGDECPARLRAALDAAAGRERAAVVAWLRAEAYLTLYEATPSDVADCIERGEHRREEKP